MPRGKRDATGAAGGGKKPPPPPARPRGKQKTPTDSQASGSSASSSSQMRFDVKDIRKTFDDSQLTHKISSSLEKFSKLVKNASPDDLFQELKRDIVLALSANEKSPHIKNLLEFITRFLVKESKSEHKENQQQSAPTRRDSSSESDELVDELDDNHSRRRSGSGRRGSSGSASTTMEPGWNMIDNVLMDVIIPQLMSTSATVRINTCNLIRKLLVEINDMETTVYQELHKKLKDRMSDKAPLVRAAAVKALYRFQEADDSDIVRQAFMFHLENDPSFEVRQAVLLALEPTKSTLQIIIARTRDVKDAVRMSAFRKITERVTVRSLSIDQRLFVLRNGLEDKSSTVRRYVEKELLTQWLKTVDGDMIKLLSFLDIQDDPEIIDKMLNKYWKSFLEQKASPEGPSSAPSKTQLHAYVQHFRSRFLDSRKLLLKEPLTSENTFVWRSLVVFCRENLTEIQPLNERKAASEAQSEADAEIDAMMADIRLPEDPSQEASSSSQDETITQSESADDTMVETGPTPPKRKKILKDDKISAPPDQDLVDLILPELPHLCHFLRKVATSIDAMENMNEIEEYNYEFMYLEFMKILQLIEIGDKAQEDMLCQLIRDIIFLPKFTSKMLDAINPLMKIMAFNVHKNDFKSLMSFTESVTTRINNEVAEQAEDQKEEMIQDKAKDLPKELTPDERRRAEMACAKCHMRIELLTDELESFVKDKTAEGYKKAAACQEELDQLIKQKTDFERQLGLMSDEEIMQDDDPNSGAATQGQSSPDDEQEPVTLAQVPHQLIKCLQTFTGCVEYGKFRFSTNNNSNSGDQQINTFIQSHLTNIVSPVFDTFSGHLFFSFQ